MLDVHFDNQVLRLASANCECGLLIKTILGKAYALQYFACILNHPTHGCRLIEDFQTIQDIIDDHEEYYLEIKECPFKYEMFRRPTLIFGSEFTTILNKDQANFQANLQGCLRSNSQDLRLKSRLHYALGQQTCKKADFLLKTDAKLGGVLMYNSSSSKAVAMIYGHDFQETFIGSLFQNASNAASASGDIQTESQIGYFIFVILSEYDLHYVLPKPSSKKLTFQIIFKPKANNKSSYGKPA